MISTTFCDGGNIIINSVLDIKIGYMNEEFHVPVLLFANDGLLLARSCGEAEDVIIGMVVGAAGRMWLQYK